MRTRATTTTAATTLALAVLVGGCNSQGEPTDSTSTASGPSSSTSVDEAKAEKDSAMDAFSKWWRLNNAANPSEPPSAKKKALMTESSYNQDVDFAKAAPKVTVEGRDKLTATEAKVKWSSGGLTATIEVCYTVGKQFLAAEDVTTEAGDTVKKGADLRTDQNGKKIKAGTEMVNLVTMKRDRDDDAPWQVDATEVGYKKSCDIGERS